MRGNKTEVVLKIVLVPLFWSMVFPLSKIILEKVPPISVVALRYTAGAAFLCTISLAGGAGREMSDLLRNRWPTMFLLGFAAVGSYASQVIALRYASTAEGAIIASTAPVYATILAAIFLEERIGVNQVLGLLLSLAGVTGIALAGEQGAGNGNLTGTALMFVGAITYSAYTVLGKKLGASSTSVLAVSTGLGTIPFLLWAVFREPLLPALRSVPSSAWTNLVALGILPTGIAVVWYFSLVSRLGAARASAVSYLVPVFGLVQSSFLLHETIGPAVLLGGAACLAGVALAQRPAKEASGIRESQEGSHSHAEAGRQNTGT